MALVADFQNPESGAHGILAVGRLTKMRGGPEAEVAVLVTDAHQGEGMGTELVRRLIEVGRDEKLERVIAQMLPENEAMMSLARKLDFRVEPYSDRDDLIMVLDLGRSPRHATETYNWR